MTSTRRPLRLWRSSRRGTRRLNTVTSLTGFAFDPLRDIFTLAAQRTGQDTGHMGSQSPTQTASGRLTALYDRAAEGWQAGIERLGYGQAYAELCEKAVACHALPAGARVLDAGTGTGALAAALKGAAPVPLGFDLLDTSADMLDQARGNLADARQCLVGAVGSAPLDAQAYDVVLCGHVIEHCDDPQEALDWLIDRLRSGGLLVLCVSKPHWCTALVRWRWGNKAYRPDVVTPMLAAAGATDIDVLRHASGPPSRISCGYLATRRS